MALKGSSISVFESKELQATILALRGMDKELSAQIRKATKSVTQTEWQRALSSHASSSLDQAVLVKSGRVAASNKNISLKSGTLGTKLSGGAKTFELTGGVEFGAHPDKRIRSRSSKGKAYTRRLGSVFKPYKATGYVAYPAAAETIPRIAALWVQTVVRTFHEAIEKGTG
jgi:hypothetical protein